jgi:cell wall-associated NlpC family hydrolase
LSVTFTTVIHSLWHIRRDIASRTERDSIVAKRLSSTAKIRRGAVLTAVLAAVSGYALYAGTGGAGAAPAPTISQVTAEVNSLQARVDKIGERYDAAGQQLAAARAQLTRVSKQTASAQAAYNTAQTGLTAVAVAEYENSNQSSILGLLSSGNPSAVLSQASLVTQIAGTHAAEAAQFLVAARALANVRMQRQHTEDGVAQLQAQLKGQKSTLTKLLSSKQATLDSLTTAQQQAVAAATVGATQTTASTGSTQSGTTSTTYTGPTSSQADQAIAFAYAQIGKPYQWGATGPGSYDCSGLVQAAWAAAGVSIPRTTYDDWASLPHVPLSDLQPGDLILYEGEGHVAIYVGGGYIVDAPTTGSFVEKVAEAGWYASSADGAVRP